MNENITVTKDVLTEAYKNGDKNVKNTLIHIFGTEMFHTKNIMERVKTFEDAVKELGEDNPLVKAYNAWAENGCDDQKDVDVFFKLRIITAALNEGWEPKFTKGEWRYYPYFFFYTKEQYDSMSKEQRVNLIPINNGTTAAIGASEGLAYAHSNHVPSAADARIGSRICFKTRELAEYAGKQFIKLYFYTK